MTPRLLLVALALLPSLSRAEGLDRLQGAWQAQAGPTGEVVVTLSIDGDRFEQSVETSPRSSFSFKGRLRLAGSGGTGQLDWVDVVGPDGLPMPDALALYQLDGDTLTICSAAPGEDRPEALAAGRGRFPSLRSYRRVVEAPEEDLAGDLLAMQGNWSGSLGPNGALSASLVIQGRTARFVIVGPDGQEVLASSGRVQLDEAATPRAMDWIPEAEGSSPVLSIYELDGPSIRVCLGIGRGPTPRPEAFTEDFRTFTLKKGEEEEEPAEDGIPQP
jgi:uncharacterized protein (TIGR03067 family)